MVTVDEGLALLFDQADGRGGHFVVNEVSKLFCLLQKHSVA